MIGVIVFLVYVCLNLFLFNSVCVITKSLGSESNGEDKVNEFNDEHFYSAQVLNALFFLPHVIMYVTCRRYREFVNDILGL